MKRRQFEEILDECISSCLSGRRTVEDSLSLYPSIARELGPLLRAAVDTADAFQGMSPSAHVQERIRINIQRAATERAAARALTRNIDGFSSRRRRNGHWWLATPLVSAATAAIVVAGFLFLREDTSDSGGDAASVSVVERPEFAAHLNDARRHLEALQSKAAGGEEVTLEDIDGLLGTTLRLAGEAQPGLDAADREAVEQILEEQIALLSQLTGASGENSEEIEDAVETTVRVGVVFGVALDAARPDASPDAAATATPWTASAADSSPGDDSPAAPSSTSSPTPAPPSRN